MNGNGRYSLALLVVGIALVLGSSTLNLGVAISNLGILLTIVAAGALLWELVRPHHRV